MPRLVLPGWRCAPSARSRGAAVVAATAIALVVCPLRAYAQGRTPADSARLDSLRRDSIMLAHRHTLPPVRVVAEPTRRSDAASSVVILPEAIRTTPATNVWDIVRQTAGVEVHQQGQGPGFASDAVMRGFTSDHSTDVAISIDGVPLNQPVNGHAEGYADWNSVLPEAVSTIRVLKGPVSPWTGNFAMGGEIEVETVPVAVGTRWSLGTGSYGDLRATVVTGNAGENGGYALAADAQREDGWRRNSRSSMEHLLFNRTWQTNDSSRTSLGVLAHAAQWNSPGFLTLDQFHSGDLHGAVDPTDGGNAGSGMVRGSITRPIGRGSLESLLWAQGGRWHLFLNIPPEGGIGEGEEESQTEELDSRFDVGGRTRWSRQLGGAHVMVGLQYRGVFASYERYLTEQRERTEPFVFEDGDTARVRASYLTAAPAVEAHWDLTSALSIGLGGRVDIMRYATRPKDGGTTTSATHAVATPKVSAVYRLTDALSAYASFNGGFRSADGVIAEPSLEPLREWASEVGFRASGERFEGSVALFRVDIRNDQTFNQVTQAIENTGRSRRQGVEFDGRLGVIPAIALFTHATINDAKYLDIVNDEGESLRGVNVFGVARATVEGGVDFQYRGAIGSIWAAYTGPFTPIGEPDQRTSPYTLLDFRGSVPVATGWSIALGVQNILDRRYPEVRASGFVSPGQARTILVTLRRGR